MAFVRRVKRPTEYRFCQFNGNVTLLAQELNMLAGKAVWSGLEIQGTGGSPTLLFAEGDRTLYYAVRVGFWYAPLTPEHFEYATTGPLLTEEGGDAGPTGFGDANLSPLDPVDPIRPGKTAKPNTP